MDVIAGRYLSIIDSPEAQPVDILVFPELTLNQVETAAIIPHQNDIVAPCNNNKYSLVVQNISCAAKRQRKYVVINLTTQHNCTKNTIDSDSGALCPPNEAIYYNTAVAFDRNGYVISTWVQFLTCGFVLRIGMENIRIFCLWWSYISVFDYIYTYIYHLNNKNIFAIICYFHSYRKFNLFNDDNITRTSRPDYSTFITDFNVTFALFICFDIVLYNPAVKLVERGIQNFIMPTMWFSELPFSTGMLYMSTYMLYANTPYIIIMITYIYRYEYGNFSHSYFWVTFHTQSYKLSKCVVPIILTYVELLTPITIIIIYTMQKQKRTDTRSVNERNDWHACMILWRPIWLLIDFNNFHVNKS